MAVDTFEAERQTPVEVWEASVQTLNLWALVGHMWVYGPMGGRICLRWESIIPRLSVREAQDGPIPPGAIDGLGILEQTLVRNQGRKGQDDG